jgi:hypothetical protein
MLGVQSNYDDCTLPGTKCFVEQIDFTLSEAYTLVLEYGVQSNYSMMYCTQPGTKCCVEQARLTYFV